MSIISRLYDCIVLISPRVEIRMRKLYWRNVKHLKRFRPYNSPSTKEQGYSQKVDFGNIEDYLRSQGIGKGSLLVVHSSYDHLASTDLTPEEIVDRLLHLIGPSGTLAMPAMRKYKGEPEGYDRLTVSTDNLVCTYKPRKTMVKTGWLPYAMVKRSDSIVSLHPLDTMVAIGPLAKAMMEHNLDGENPASHGPGSSWKFCYDNDAKIIGLGVNLFHYNSILHVNEEAMGNWPIKDEDWFRIRKFHIIDGDFDEFVSVRERKPEWGMIRLAEKNMEYDLTCHNLITKKVIGNIEVYTEDAKSVINHMQEYNKQNRLFYI